MLLLIALRESTLIVRVAIAWMLSDEAACAACVFRAKTGPVPRAHDDERERLRRLCGRTARLEALGGPSSAWRVRAARTGERHDGVLDIDEPGCAARCVMTYRGFAACSPVQQLARCGVMGADDARSTERKRDRVEFRLLRENRRRAPELTVACGARPQSEVGSATTKNLMLKARARWALLATTHREERDVLGSEPRVQPKATNITPTQKAVLTTANVHRAQPNASATSANRGTSQQARQQRQRRRSAGNNAEAIHQRNHGQQPPAQPPPQDSFNRPSGAHRHRHQRNRATTTPTGGTTAPTATTTANAESPPTTAAHHQRNQRQPATAPPSTSATNGDQQRQRRKRRQQRRHITSATKKRQRHQRNQRAAAPAQPTAAAPANNGQRHHANANTAQPLRRSATGPPAAAPPRRTANRRQRLWTQPPPGATGGDNNANAESAAKQPAHQQRKSGGTGQQQLTVTAETVQPTPAAPPPPRQRNRGSGLYATANSRKQARNNASRSAANNGAHHTSRRPTARHQAGTATSANAAAHRRRRNKRNRHQHDHAAAQRQRSRTAHPAQHGEATNSAKALPAEPAPGDPTEFVLGGVSRSSTDVPYVTLSAGTQYADRTVFGTSFLSHNRLLQPL
ncbi:hypothetical protein FQA39_LY18992 [Lamprigera yunnana]|nr:hypothetical protein FQA39_LY18992 [Lamprigera yunnana]